MQSFEDFVEERRMKRELKKQKIKKILYSILFLVLVCFLFFTNRYIQQKIDYGQIKYNDNKISRVIIIDELQNIDEIIKSSEYRYFIQIDVNNNKELLNTIGKLEKKLVKYYIYKENKITKLNLLLSFSNLEEAEKHAKNLVKDKMITNYTVRIR